MTLKKIDERLSLFNEYLLYRIEAKLNHVVHVDLSAMRDITVATAMKLHAEQGWMLINSTEVWPKSNTSYYSFDQWLWENNHRELVTNDAEGISRDIAIDGKRFTRTIHNGITYDLIKYDL